MGLKLVRIITWIWSYKLMFCIVNAPLTQITANYSDNPRIRVKIHKRDG